MKNKKYILATAILTSLFLIMLFSNFVNAGISDDTLTISVYNVDNISNSGDEEITFRVDFNSSEYDGNDKSIEFTINISDIIEESKISEEEFDYIVQTEVESILNIDYKEQAEKCIDEKASINIGYTKCSEDLDECKNDTNYKDEYNNCQLDLQKKDLDIQSKSSNIDTLTQEKNDTQNQKWFFGIGGVIAGVLGLLFKQGKLGSNPRDSSESEFNKFQAA